MRVALNRTLFAPALLVFLASCASPPSDGIAPVTASEAPAAGSPQPDESYVLNPQELKLDCRKLIGRMQVRILQIRDHNQRARPSGASRVAQQAATTLYGGSQQGMDPDAEYRRDRVTLEAYNRQLGAKKCKTFDLEAELKPKPARATPTPTRE